MDDNSNTCLLKSYFALQQPAANAGVAEAASSHSARCTGVKRAAPLLASAPGGTSGQKVNNDGSGDSRRSGSLPAAAGPSGEQRSSCPGLSARLERALEVPPSLTH